MINRTTLVDARRSEAMTNAALEMERSYRQYCVLDDPTLAQRLSKPAASATARCWTPTPACCRTTKLWQALRQDVSDLAQLQCNNSGPDAAGSRADWKLSPVTTAIWCRRPARSSISRGQQLQQEIAERGQFFGWQALVLFLVSLALVLLFTRMIIGPVKGIERMINQSGGREVAGRSPYCLPARASCDPVGKRIIWLSERLAWLESQRHQFLRHLSHELKTPLASMREGTELLADRGRGAPDPRAAGDCRDPRQQ